VGNHQYPTGFCVGIQDNLVSEEPTITKKFPHYKETCWTEKCPNERVGIWNRSVATNIHLDHCSSSSPTPIFWSMYVMVVSVFHSCASSTNPLQLHNSTMFLEVTWTSSSKLGHTSWLELSTFAGLMLLIWMHLCWILFSFSCNTIFNTVIFLFFGDAFFPIGFSSLLHLWDFVHGYFIGPCFREPYLVFCFCFSPYISLMGGC